jgi:hypothetical protein
MASGRERILPDDWTHPGNHAWTSPLAKQSTLSLSAVNDLDDAIRRIELRAEQFIIHLRSMQRDAPGTKQIRSVLLVMLLRLVALKGRCQHLEDKITLDQVA